MNYFMKMNYFYKNMEKLQIDKQCVTENVLIYNVLQAWLQVAPFF